MLSFYDFGKKGSATLNVLPPSSAGELSAWRNTKQGALTPCLIPLPADPLTRKKVEIEKFSLTPAMGK